MPARQMNEEMRWQNWAVLGCPGAAPKLGKSSCPPDKASVFYRAQSKWQIQPFHTAALPCLKARGVTHTFLLWRYASIASGPKPSSMAFFVFTDSC